jgi:predicted nucleic acid-binding protein
MQMTQTFEVYVVDAHALVWYQRNDDRLGERAREILERAEDGVVTVVVPTIALAEVQRISERRFPELTVRSILQRFPSIVVAPFDAETFGVMQAVSPALELHDRIIAATSQVFAAPLVTVDRVLREHVETIW